MKQQFRVDWPACRARGLCHELIPEVIDLDEWGYPIVNDKITRELLPKLAQPSAPAQNWRSSSFAEPHW